MPCARTASATCRSASARDSCSVPIIIAKTLSVWTRADCGLSGARRESMSSITALRYRSVARWLQISFLPTFGAVREKGAAMRREWELEDLIGCWTLDEEEFRLLASKSGATRLGFSLMLKFFEQEARFPRREDVPKAAVDFVAGQVKVAPALFAEYDFTSRQVKNHRRQIREYHGFREPAVGDEDTLI